MLFDISKNEFSILCPISPKASKTGVYWRHYQTSTIELFCAKDLLVFDRILETSLLALRQSSLRSWNWSFIKTDCTEEFSILEISKIKEFNLILHLTLGIYDSRVTKPTYKTELRIMTSQTELLTLNFF